MANGERRAGRGRPHRRAVTAACAVALALTIAPASAVALTTVRPVFVSVVAAAPVTLHDPLQGTTAAVGGTGPRALVFRAQGTEQVAAIAPLDVPPLCETPTVCRDRPVVVTNHDRFLTESGAVVLPAGAYEMYLISSAGPVSVDLSALGSVTTQGPVVPVDATVQHLPVRSTPTPEATGNVLFVAGDVRPLARGGIWLLALAVHTDPAAAGYAQLCVYENEPPSDAFEPGCPGEPSDRDRRLVGNAGPGGGGYVLSRVDLHADSGPLGLGGNAQGAGLRDATAIGAWIAPPPPAPAAVAAPSPGVVRLSRATLRGSHVRLRVACVSPTACIGELLAGRLSGARVRLAPGRTSWFALRASRALRRQFRRRRRVPVTIRYRAAEAPPVSLRVVVRRRA